MKTLTFSVITDVALCNSLWEQFSPKRELYDLWKFRYLRFTYKEAEPYFVLGKDGEKAVGLFPLQITKETGIIEPFGRATCLYENVWLLPGYKNAYRQFYNFLADKPAVISIGKLQHTYNAGFIEKEKPKFTLRIKGHKNYEDYMDDLWREKDRRKMQKDIARLHRNYRVEVKQATPRSLEKMFKLSIQRFGQESSFSPSWIRDMYKDIARHMETDVIIIKINGKTEAVGMSVIYGDTYYGINSGSSRAIPSLGKYLYLMKIERAIALGLNRYYAGRGDFGNWKTTFAMEPVAQWRFITPLGREAEKAAATA